MICQKSKQCTLQVQNINHKKEEAFLMVASCTLSISNDKVVNILVQACFVHHIDLTRDQEDICYGKSK